MTHIKHPVTLTPEQAETLYKAGVAVAELSERLTVGDEVPLNALMILGDQFIDLFENHPGFTFE